MASFETLLEMHRKAAERYVHYRCASPQDAEDILQDVYFTAHRHFHQLKNEHIWLRHHTRVEL